MNSKKIKILQKISDGLYSKLKNCTICPRHCKVDRLSGKVGFCESPINPVIYSYQKHHGEEPPISGKNGSGTIFFSGCNLRCAYCQNYSFSQTIVGDVFTIEDLANIMLDLQLKKSHNINLVTPTTYIPQIIKALEIASLKGLTIPIVYNTSGYEDPEIIKLLDGVIDIYLADMRYSENSNSKLYSGAGDYVEYNRRSLKEMYHQVGTLKTGPLGIAKSGIIIRLLILPDNIAGLEDTLKFISNELTDKAHISLLSQYFPAFKAADYKSINRYISEIEYKRASELLEKYNFTNGWVQEYQDSVDKNFAGPYIRKKEDIK